VTDRLFFALWPGVRQREALVRIQRELPSQRCRPTHPEDFHITLVFLGDVDANRRCCAEEAADRVCGAPFSLKLDSFGCFPRTGVLWCGASESPRPLLDLLQGLNSGLLDCGFRPERRPFKPHVTLARKARPLRQRALEQAVSWPASEFALVIARPGERPRYRVERRWPLIQ
jgi:2'-5' RNA ligase